MRDRALDGHSEQRSDALLHDLAHELALAPSGVGFISSCLDRVVERWELREAVAVVNDSMLGIQLFNAGRRPFDFGTSPAELLARGPGIHTDPTVLEGTDDLDAVARLCEVALRLDRLHYESLHDPLTGLYNRRGFEDQLGAAASRSVRYGWAFALVLVDLDGFKAVNDRLGHQGGDAVLREVGDRLRYGLRAGDVAARVGGDEFALLVHLDDPGTLSGVLERLHEPGRWEDVEIGWTVGTALCPSEAASVDDLYRVADGRLYDAKSSGSNAPPVA